MDKRIKFEAKFPVPDGVYWDESVSQYDATEQEYEPDADIYHWQWVVWQSATEAARGGEKSGVWQFFQDGEWHVGMNQLNHRENTEAAGYLVRDLYTHPPAPVVPEGWREELLDLRSDMRSDAERQGCMYLHYFERLCRIVDSTSQETDQ